MLSDTRAGDEVRRGGEICKKVLREGLIAILLVSSFLTIDLAQAANEGVYKEVNWEMLIAKGCDPAAQFKSLNLSSLSDGDPKAMEVLQAIKSIWDNAPAAPSMNGRNIRIPGFMIPLDQTGESVRSFLLAPYFGGVYSLAAPAIQADGAACQAPARISWHEAYAQQGASRVP